MYIKIETLNVVVVVRKNCRAVARGTTPQRLSHDSCADFYIIRTTNFERE